MISISTDIFKTEELLVDFLEYNVSLIWNLVPFDRIMFALSRPSIKFDVRKIMHILAFVSVKLKKLFFNSKACV